jgi:hypothetical protein
MSFVLSPMPISFVSLSIHLVDSYFGVEAKTNHVDMWEKSQWSKMVATMGLATTTLLVGVLFRNHSPREYKHDHNNVLS